MESESLARVLIVALTKDIANELFRQHGREAVKMCIERQLDVFGARDLKYRGGDF